MLQDYLENPVIEAQANEKTNDFPQFIIDCLCLSLREVYLLGSHGFEQPPCNIESCIT